LFWVSLTVGRLLGAFIARVVHVRTLILVQTGLHLLSVITLNKYALADPKIFWFLTVVEGLIVAPLYPLGVAYGHSILNLSGVCLMVIVFAGSFGDLTYLWTAGKMYDIYGGASVLHAASVAAWIVVISLVLFRILSKLSSASQVKTQTI
jgi:fucose permease